jgi:hypothetical protein
MTALPGAIKTLKEFGNKSLFQFLPGAIMRQIYTNISNKKIKTKYFFMIKHPPLFSRTEAEKLTN